MTTMIFSRHMARSWLTGASTLLSATLLATAALAEEAPTSISDCSQAFAAMQFQEAETLCLPAAESGDAEASFLLATVHGLRRRDQLAFEWMEKAAKASHPQASLKLGMAYQQGRGTGVDLESAAHWYRQAAQLGSAKGQHKLAVLYQFGEGVEQNLQQARHWYQQAADQGEAESQLQLGLLMLKGGEDSQAARRWIEQAANAGNDAAQFALGVLLQEQDPAASLDWYRKAAAANNPHALHNLAILYYQGQGVAKDDRQALHFAQRSVQAGRLRNVALVLRIQASLDQQAQLAEAIQVATDTTGSSGAAAPGTLSRTTSSAPVAKAKDPSIPGTALDAPRPLHLDSALLVDPKALPVSSLTALLAPENQASTQPIKAATQRPARSAHQALTIISGAQAATSLQDPGVAWLFSRPADHYVIQLSSPRKSVGLEDFVRRNRLQGQARYYRTQRADGPVYLLLYGEFADLGQALAAIKTLPAEAQRESPWVRNLGRLQRRYQEPSL